MWNAESKRRSTVASGFRRYGMALIFGCSGLALALAFGEPSTWFIIAILASTLYGGTELGVVAAAISFCAFIFFIPKPHIFTFIFAALSVLVFAEAKRKADAKKRIAEQLFNTRLTVDSIPGMVGTLTPEGQPEFYNSRLLEYLGKTSEQMRDWPTIIHPMDQDRVYEAWLKSMATGAPLDVEHRGVVADGSYRWFTNRGLPMFDENGKILRWYHLVTDTDDRKRAEEALRASELNFRTIVESIPGMVLTAAANGEIEFANQQLLSFFDKTLENLKEWSVLVHPDDRAYVVRLWSEALESGQPFEAEHRVLRADGAYRWFHTRGQPVRGNDGRINRWTNLHTDISARKHAEAALQQTQNRLSQATQIASLSELSASIAHEINQPLAAVVANGHACLRWLSAQPQNIGYAREAAERIIRDGTEAGEVASRIRALFKRATTESAPLDLNEIVDEVIHLVASEATKRSVTVEADLDKSLPRTMGDRVQLQQLVFNLLLNGVEAMDSISLHPKTVFIRSCRGDSGTIIVQVEDRGIGLINSSKIFDAFFTTKETGMGMGLAICRSIIETHGGRLWAESNKGPGATFTFALPIKPSQI